MLTGDGVSLTVDISCKTYFGVVSRWHVQHGKTVKKGWAFGKEPVRRTAAAAGVYVGYRLVLPLNPG